MYRITPIQTGSSAPALGALLLMTLAAGCGTPSPPAAISSAAAPTPVPSSLEIRSDASDPGRIEAVLSGEAARRLNTHLQKSGISPDSVLYVTLRRPGEEGAPVPILAGYSWDDPRGTATVVPRVSLTPGLAYRAIFEGPRIDASLSRLTADYSVPVDRSASDVRILAVHPGVPEVPANLLKFYVHFSRPMAEGEVFRHARLLDERGVPLEQPFREVELWADEHRRLTLWVNPGRTKRSLGLSESLGPVLTENRSYTLEILAGLKDARGRPLSSALRHPFRTAGVDREQPRIGSWSIQTPLPGATTPLLVKFPESMDHALAGRVIRVESPLGESVTGTATVSEDGREWRFVPAKPWDIGEHALVAGGELEDLAGNSLFRPFETKDGQGAKPVAEPPDFKRQFTVTAAGL